MLLGWMEWVGKANRPPSLLALSMAYMGHAVRDDIKILGYGSVSSCLTICSKCNEIKITTVSLIDHTECIPPSPGRSSSMLGDGQTANQSPPSPSRVWLSKHRNGIPRNEIQRPHVDTEEGKERGAALSTYARLLVQTTLP